MTTRTAYARRDALAAEGLPRIDGSIRAFKELSGRIIGASRTVINEANAVTLMAVREVTDAAGGCRDRPHPLVSCSEAGNE